MLVAIVLGLWTRLLLCQYRMRAGVVDESCLPHGRRNGCVLGEETWRLREQSPEKDGHQGGESPDADDTSPGAIDGTVWNKH